MPFPRREFVSLCFYAFMLLVSVIPNAKHEKREQQTDLLGNTIYKVRLTVPPIDGKANAALIAFLSKQFDLPKSSFTIVRGKTSRQKVVEIKNR
jgi:uncharacterized protein